MLLLKNGFPCARGYLGTFWRLRIVKFLIENDWAKQTWRLCRSARYYVLAVDKECVSLKETETNLLLQCHQIVGHEVFNFNKGGITFLFERKLKLRAAVGKGLVWKTLWRENSKCLNSLSLQECGGAITSSRELEWASIYEYTTSRPSQSHPYSPEDSIQFDTALSESS